jgi:hypothetical protein
VHGLRVGLEVVGRGDDSLGAEPPAIRPAKIIPPSDGVSAARARPPNLPTNPGVVAPFCTRPTIAVVIAV